MRPGADNCSPGEHSHSDQPNFTLESYLAMCSAGEAKFAIAEAARVWGVSRAFVYRAMLYASIPADEFEDVLDATVGRGLFSPTAVADEIKRRTGKAKRYAECCPHCGGVVRYRER